MTEREIIHYLKEKFNVVECYEYTSTTTIYEDEINYYKKELCNIDLVSDYEFLREKDKFLIKVYAHVNICDLLEDIKIEFRR